MSYTTDSSAPSISISSVAGDNVASYFDTVNDGATMINVSGEASMSCRWSSSDQAYSSMSNDCAIDGIIASCNMTDSISSGFHNYYVSCKDQYNNEQNSSNNLNVQFYLDYTDPTTSDNSNTNIQAPPYIVTITEQDDVDSDVTTYYCTDTSDACTPTTLIDSGGQITFSSSNRGVNYFRYYSTDDAGNSQTVVSKTININQLPVFTSASDNATIIGGGELVNVTSVNSDSDSGQQITMYVCNSENATFEGCGGTEYCSVSGTSNLTCSFNGGSSSATYNWYAYIFDDSDENATANPKSGSYTVDATVPELTILGPENITYTQDSVTAMVQLNEAGSYVAYSLDEEANVSLNNLSSTLWSITLSGLSDGIHNISFVANDSYGNLAWSSTIFFSVDTAVSDTSSPSISVVSPSNNTYYTTTDVLLNITSDEDLSWAGYTNNSGTLTDLGNTSTTSWNKTVTFVEGQQDIIFYANDTSDNQGNYSLMMYVDLNNPAVNFSCGDVDKSEDVSCSLNSTDTLDLDYAIVSWNSTGTWQNSSQISLSGTSEESTYNILYGNTSSGTFWTQAYVFDSSGRLNGTETNIVTIGDDSFPELGGIIYSPNTTALLDDGVSVDFNVTVTEDYNISIVYLMYRNSTASDWTYLEMNNNSVLVVGLSSEIVYNATLTLAEENWTVKYNATDNAGNENVSANYSLIVADDNSYWNSTDIPAIKSFTYAQRLENNTLGNILLNNTGDGDLNFTINISSAIESRFDVNYSSSQDAVFETSSVDNLSLVLLVNTTDLTSGLYDYNIIISSDIETIVYEKKLNVQTAFGPYLVVSIDTYSSSVTRGQEDVSFVAIVTNLGTQDAEGVYLNWSLPDDFSLNVGSLTRSVGNLGIGVSATNTITLDVSSSTSESSASVSAVGTADNLNSTTDTKSITITDPIVITEIVDVPGGSTSGGGSTGGTSGGGSEQIVYDKIVEIVRGEKDLFEIEVTNIYPNSTLENIEIKIEGFLEQYLVIDDLVIDSIGYDEIRKIRVNVSAPTYKNYEEHDLKVTITGTLIRSTFTSSYKEIQNIKLIIQEISRIKAEESLNESEKAIAEMVERGFYVGEATMLFNKSKNSLEEIGIYKDSYDFSQQIIEIKDSAFNSDDLLRRIIFALQDPKKSNLLVGNIIKNLGAYDREISLIELFRGRNVFSNQDVESLIELGIVAFERGGYDVAFKRAQEARNLLVLERKGNLLFFLYLNWQYLIAGIIIFTFIGLLWHRFYEKRSLGKRILDINEEEKNIRKKEIENQRNYFKGKKDISNYKFTIQKNQSKLAKLKKERLTLRNKRIKLLKSREINKELNAERREVERDIKNIQNGYYKNKTISKSEYDLQFESFNERLAEIEGETTNLEVIEHKKINKQMNEHKKPKSRRKKK